MCLDAVRGAGCRCFRHLFKSVALGGDNLLRDQHFTADRAVLTLRQTGFRAGGSLGFVNDFRMALCLNQAVRIYIRADGAGVQGVAVFRTGGRDNLRFIAVLTIGTSAHGKGIGCRQAAFAGCGDRNLSLLQDNEGGRILAILGIIGIEVEDFRITDLPALNPVGAVPGEEAHAQGNRIGVTAGQYQFQFLRCLGGKLHRCRNGSGFPLGEFYAEYIGIPFLQVTENSFAVFSVVFGIFFIHRVAGQNHARPVGAFHGKGVAAGLVGGKAQEPVIGGYIGADRQGFVQRNGLGRVDIDGDFCAAVAAGYPQLRRSGLLGNKPAAGIIGVGNADNLGIQALPHHRCLTAGGNTLGSDEILPSRRGQIAVNDRIGKLNGIRRGRIGHIFQPEVGHPAQGNTGVVGLNQVGNTCGQLYGRPADILLGILVHRLHPGPGVRMGYTEPNGIRERNFTGGCGKQIRSRFVRCKGIIAGDEIPANQNILLIGSRNHLGIRNGHGLFRGDTAAVVHRPDGNGSRLFDSDKASAFVPGDDFQNTAVAGGVRHVHKCVRGRAEKGQMIGSSDELPQIAVGLQAHQRQLRGFRAAVPTDLPVVAAPGISGNAVVDVGRIRDIYNGSRGGIHIERVCRNSQAILCGVPKGDGFQVRAVTERVFPNGCDILRDGDFRQILAVGKGKASDAVHLFGEHHGLDLVPLFIPGSAAVAEIIHTAAAGDGENAVHNGISEILPTAAAHQAAACADTALKVVPRGNHLLFHKHLSADRAFRSLSEAVFSTGGSGAGDGFLGVVYGGDKNVTQFVGAVFIGKVLTTG